MPDDDRDARLVLSEALFTDPDTRPVMEDLIVKKYPKAAATIPGYAGRKSAEAKLTELEKRMDADKAERERERITSEADAEWARAAEQFELADADRPAVEKIMTERRVANFEDAAERFARGRQVAAPRSESRYMQIPGVKGAGGDFYKGIVEDPEGWARDASEQIMGDFQRGQGTKWL